MTVIYGGNHMVEPTEAIEIKRISEIAEIGVYGIHANCHIHNLKNNNNK